MASDAQSKLAAHTSLILCKVLDVTLTAPEPSALGSSPFFLADLGATLLDASCVESALTDRLSAFEDMQAATTSTSSSPIAYLVAVYRRALEEERRASNLKDKEFAETLVKTLAETRQYAISYTGMVLQHSMFVPAVWQEEAKKPKSSLVSVLLLPHMLSAGSAAPGLASMATDAAGAPEPLPHGFFDALCVRFAEDGLEDIVRPLLWGLNEKVQGVSPLGDFRGPTGTLAHLLENKAIAAVMASTEGFDAANVRDGRAVENESLLGPFFKLSCLPDVFWNGQPSVTDLFVNLSNQTPAAIRASVNLLRAALVDAQETLFRAVRSALRETTVRESIVAWFASALRHNAGRAKMQFEKYLYGSHGFIVNVAAVLLKLCMPFMNPDDGKAFARISPAWIDGGGRVDWSEVTKLVMSGQGDDEDASAVGGALSPGTVSAAAAATTQNTPTAPSDRPGTAGGGGCGSFHFICDCFFLTGYALHLGVVRALNEHVDSSRDLSRRIQFLQEMERARPQLEGTPMATTLDQRMSELRGMVEDGQRVRYLYEAGLLEDGLLESCLAYYRLVMRWLLKEADAGDGPTAMEGVSSAASTSAVERANLEGKEPTAAFKRIPDFFLEDTVEVVVNAARFVPTVLERASTSGTLSDIVGCLVHFMQARSFVRNPYLRAKCTEALHCLLPTDDARETTHVERHPASDGAAFISVFEGGPTGCGYVGTRLVPSLLCVFVDAEHMGTATGFYDKWMVRLRCEEILTRIWSVPQHRAIWIEHAREHGKEGGSYVQVLNMLVNDAIYHLDEVLKKLPEYRDLERQAAEFGDGGATPNAARERQELDRRIRSEEDQIRHHMSHAEAHLQAMEMTAAERATAAPYLLPEMCHRVAAMLNYFLAHLVGPQRKKLKVSDPTKVGFNPKGLLRVITSIIIRLDAVSSDNVLAAGAVADQRSYSEGLYPACSELLRQTGIMSEIEAVQLEAFAERCRVIHSETVEDEELMGDIPDDFTDPIMATLMRDPVILPASRAVLDRPTIARHLLTDPFDPFNRQPLKLEDLIPATELKERIDAWVAEKRKK